MARTRKGPKDQRTLMAAASRLPVGNKNALRKVFRPAADWQTECWGYYDTNPELKFAGLWVGQQMAKVKLYVAVLDGEGNPIAVTDENSGVDAGTAAAAELKLAELHGEAGTQAEVVRELAVNLDFTGECHLIGWFPREGRDNLVPWWEVRSVSEVLQKNGEIHVIGAPGQQSGRPLVADEDGGGDQAIRMWIRHPRWSDLPDSAVLGVITEARILQALSNQVLAESLSRANAGVLLVPSEITYGSDRDVPDDADGADDQEDPLMEDLTAAITNPAADPTDPSSIVPFVLRAEAEFLKEFRHVPLARVSDGALDARIDKHVNRLARGLNLPVEVVMGHMSTTFANAAQISDDEFTEYLEPRVLALVDMLTTGYLRPELVRDGADPTTVAPMFVWYDASELLDPPDMSESANDAWDRNEISGAAYRKAKGFSEEDAATTDELLTRLALRRSILTAELSLPLLQRLDPSLRMGDPAPAAEPAQDPVAAALLASIGGNQRIMQVLLGLSGIDVGTMMGDPPAVAKAPKALPHPS